MTRMKTCFAPVLVALIVGVCLWIPSGEARAGVLLGVDLNLGLDTGDLPIDSGGIAPGASLRLGYELPLPVVRIIPEAQLGFSQFTEDDQGNPTQSVLVGRAGVRVGIGGVIGPALYAHVGYARIDGEGSDFVVQSSGLSYDAGLSVDFTLLPIINLGVHGGINAIVDDGREKTFQWFDIGIHAEVNF